MQYLGQHGESLDVIVRLSADEHKAYCRFAKALHLSELLWGQGLTEEQWRNTWKALDALSAILEEGSGEQQLGTVTIRTERVIKVQR